MLTCMSSAYIPTSSHFSIRLNQNFASWPLHFYVSPTSFAPTCIFFYHLTCYLPVNAHGCGKPTIKVDHFPRETTGVPHLFLCVQGISQCSGSRASSLAEPSSQVSPGAASRPTPWPKRCCWRPSRLPGPSSRWPPGPWPSPPPRRPSKSWRPWSASGVALEGREMTEGRLNSLFF